ncbi:MAG: HNH endonuclease, partial [Phaeodactylibacter xiamenensis]
NRRYYSTTAQDWRLAGELAIGEQVLTHTGSATLTGKRPAPAQRVYNLEVQEVHNFLVSGVGVVVHNTCHIEVRNFLKDKGVNNTHLIKTPGSKHIYNGPDADALKVKYNKNKIEICYDDLGFPDFSPFVERFTNPINGNLIEAVVDIGSFEGSHQSDYNAANTILRSIVGDDNLNFPATISGINYTWHHHQDGKTMMLVPSGLNHGQYAATHLGGKTIHNKGAGSVFPSPADVGSYLKNCE